MFFDPRKTAYNSMTYKTPHFYRSKPQKRRYLFVIFEINGFQLQGSLPYRQLRNARNKSRQALLEFTAVQAA